MSSAADVAWARWNTAAEGRRTPPFIEPSDDRSARHGQHRGTITASPPPGREVDSVMAGFIFWLAQRPIPPGRRRHYHLAVERFRCWHTGPRHQPAGPDRDYARHDIVSGHRRYLAELRAAGRGHAELQVVEAALVLLRGYLEGIHDRHTCHELG